MAKTHRVEIIDFNIRKIDNFKTLLKCNVDCSWKTIVSENGDVLYLKHNMTNREPFAVKIVNPSALKERFSISDITRFNNMLVEYEKKSKDIVNNDTILPTKILTMPRTGEKVIMLSNGEFMESSHYRAMRDHFKTKRCDIKSVHSDGFYVFNTKKEFVCRIPAYNIYRTDELSKMFTKADRKKLSVAA